MLDQYSKNRSVSVSLRISVGETILYNNFLTAWEVIRHKKWSAILLYISCPSLCPLHQGLWEKSEWLLLSLIELALPWHHSLWVRTLTAYSWLFGKLFVWKLKAKLCIHKITGSVSGGSYNQPNRSPKFPTVCLLMFVSWVLYDLSRKTEPHEQHGWNYES